MSSRILPLASAASLSFGVAALPASLVLGSARANAAPMPLDTAAKLFGARPSGFAPDLSPDGDKIVYLAAGPGPSTVVHIEDLKTNADKLLVRSTGKPEHLEWCAFADERWIVCRFGGWMKQLGLTFPVARTVAVDTVAGTMRPLGAPEHLEGEGFAQFDGEILDWLPDAQGTLLMQRHYAGQNGNPDQISVDRIQVDPFKVTNVEMRLPRDLSYMTDGHGAVRLKSEARSDLNGLFTGDSTYEYRAAESNKWLPLPDSGADFTPLVIEKSSNSLYFLKPLNGRDALYRMKLDGSGSETLVASNPNVDIDSVIELGPGQPVVGYRYTDDRTRSVYFDPNTKALGDALAQALPDMPLMNIIASSRAADKLLVHAGSDVDPGVYFLLDRKSNRMDPVLNSSESIDGSGLAPMKSVSIPTADGKSIPAYVTMRSDLGAGPHPAVVMPHGGPSDRDIWAFDWLGQFLAARGYVVIQPNFRGSSGYGKDFLGENAFHEWRRVTSDIHDSADWLVKQGLADPSRMAVVGWSYGGYAALESAAMDSRYKAVVAIAPVTDLKQLRRDARGFREETVSDNEIGKGDQLSDGSPINHAADIHAPVLLVHGTVDGNVSYNHSKRMLGALQHAGDKADLLTFEGLDHQLDDSDARTQMLTRIGELLDQTIGH
jgi:dipeptidyl aminopeptidase/acylaminoacyl peptidase